MLRTLQNLNFVATFVLSHVLSVYGQTLQRGQIFRGKRPPKKKYILIVVSVAQ